MAILDATLSKRWLVASDAVFTGGPAFAIGTDLGCGEPLRRTADRANRSLHS